MLEHNIKLKVKNNKTNISYAIDKFIIDQFRWDLRSSNVYLNVIYYNEGKELFRNDFCYVEKEDIFIDDLIKDLVKQHYNGKASIS